MHRCGFLLIVSDTSSQHFAFDFARAKFLCKVGAPVKALGGRCERVSGDRNGRLCSFWAKSATSGPLCSHWHNGNLLAQVAEEVKKAAVAHAEMNRLREQLSVNAQAVRQKEEELQRLAAHVCYFPQNWWSWFFIFFG